MTFVDAAEFLILLFCSWGLATWIGRLLGLRYRLVQGLLGWHTAACLSYWYYSLSHVADATLYYERSFYSGYAWMPGTSFVNSFTKLFVDMFGLCQLNVFMIYNLFGVGGLLLLAQILLSFWPVCKGRQSYIPYLMLFSPGISFWSSAIGKDAPAFFAACLAVFAFMNIGRRRFHFALAILIMFCVRPHVALFMLIAASLSAVFGKKIRLIARVAIMLSITLAAVFVVPFALEYSGLGSKPSSESVNEYIDQRAEYNLGGGSSIDIAALPLPLQMFSYLFRPLFFDAPGILGMIVSCENLVLLCLVIIYIPRMLPTLLRIPSATLIFNIAYLLLGLSVFAMTTANLGIAVRQKTMLLPSLFVLIVVGANVQHQKKKALRKRTQVLMS